MRPSIEEMEAAVVTLLRGVGEDVNRDGLRDTLKRVVRAICEMTTGLATDPDSCLDVQFETSANGLVVLRGIRFTSLCEHHLLPFQGTASVGYIPSQNRVVCLSKLARLVLGYAKRPQLQERITEQVANAIVARVPVLGVGVRLVATHSCMGCRGVQQQDAEMVTQVLRGVLQDDPAARAEFMSMLG